MLFVEIVDFLLDVAAPLLRLSRDLLCHTYDDLLRVPYQVARLLLNLADDDFRDAFDLVFVHGNSIQ
jgi:hypothetical protein